MQTTVWVAEDVLRFCRSEAARTFPDETGGVLMGWHRPERAEVVVVHAVGPGPDAQHEGVRFTPDNNHHVTSVGDVYRRSGRKVTYLGDWHSHPNGITQPSRVDQRTLARIADHPPSRCPDPVMLLLAGSAQHGWRCAMHLWAPRPFLLWERPATTSVPVRTWTPAPNELDAINYPYA